MEVTKIPAEGKFGFLLIFLLILQIAICTKTDDVDPNSFKLYILRQDISDLELGYELEKSWLILQKVDLADNFLVITGDDIQIYDWSSQTMSLTFESSDAFTALFHDDRLDSGFVVTLDDVRLYGGCIFDFATPRGLDYPFIIRDTKKIYTNDKLPVVLHILPRTEYRIKYEQLDPSLKQRIEIPEVHEFFKKLGKLRE